MTGPTTAAPAVALSVAQRRIVTVLAWIAIVLAAVAASELALVLLTLLVRVAVATIRWAWTVRL